MRKCRVCKKRIWLFAIIDVNPRREDWYFHSGDCANKYYNAIAHLDIKFLNEIW